LGFAKPEQNGWLNFSSLFRSSPPQEWLRTFSCLGNSLNCGRHSLCEKCNTTFFSLGSLVLYHDLFLYRLCGRPLDLVAGGLDWFLFWLGRRSEDCSFPEPFLPLGQKRFRG
jgi:hypothetical protein